MACFLFKTFIYTKKNLLYKCIKSLFFPNEDILSNLSAGLDLVLTPLSKRVLAIIGNGCLISWYLNQNSCAFKNVYGFMTVSKSKQFKFKKVS